MTRGQRLIIVGATMAFAGVAMVGMLTSSPRGRADDRGDNSDSRIEQGFDIAPVPLNLEGKRHDIGAAFSPHYHPQLDAIDHLKGITRLKNSSQSSGQGKISMPFIQSVRLPERQTAFLRSLRSTVTFSKSCHGPSMAT